jgi:hypothetical protein
MAISSHTAVGILQCICYKRQSQSFSLINQLNMCLFARAHTHACVQVKNLLQSDSRIVEEALFPNNNWPPIRAATRF